MDKEKLLKYYRDRLEMFSQRLINLEEQKDSDYKNLRMDLRFRIIECEIHIHEIKENIRFIMKKEKKEKKED